MAQMRARYLKGEFACNRASASVASESTPAISLVIRRHRRFTSANASWTSCDAATPRQWMPLARYPGVMVACHACTASHRPLSIAGSLPAALCRQEDDGWQRIAMSCHDRRQCR